MRERLGHYFPATRRRMCVRLRPMDCGKVTGIVWCCQMGAVIGLALLASGYGTRARAGGGGSQETARELVRVAFSTQMFDAMVKQAARAGVTMVKTNMEARTGRPMTTAEQEKVSSAFQRSFRKVFPQAEWETLMSEIIARHFTEDDLREVLGFYRTPVGAKVMRLNTVVSQDGASAGERFIRTREQEFNRVFQEELRQEFPRGG